MKRCNALWIAVCFFVAVTVQAQAADSVKSGNWNDPTTWSGNAVPLASENVLIKDNHTVTLTASASCAKLTITSAGILLFAVPNITTTTLTVTSEWNCSGTVRASRGSAGTDWGTIKIGTLSGPLTFTHSGAKVEFGRVEVKANGDITLPAFSAFELDVETPGKITQSGIISRGKTTDDTSPSIYYSFGLKVTLKSTGGDILMDSFTNSATSLESLNASGDVKWKNEIANSANASLTVKTITAGGAVSVSETLETLELTENITAGGAVLLSAGGSVSPPNAGKAITITGAAGVSRQIKTTNGSISLYGMVKANSASAGNNKLIIEAAQNAVITGNIGEQTGIFDELTVKAGGSSNEVKIYGDTARAGIYAKKITLTNAPVVFSRASPSVPSDIITDELSLDSGSKINGGTGQLTFTVVTPDRKIEVNSSQTLPAALFINTAKWGNAAGIFASELALGSGDAGLIKVGAAIGSSGTRFPYALTFINNAASNIEFHGNLYSSKNVTLDKPAGGAGIISCKSGASTFDLGGGRWNVKTGNVKTNFEGSGAKSITASGGIDLGEVTAAASGASLALTNNTGQVYLYGDIVVNGNFTQTGTGATLIAKQTTQGAYPAAGPFLFNTSGGNGDITFGGNIEPFSTSQGLHVRFEAGTGGVTVAANVGSASKKFNDIEIYNSATSGAAAFPRALDLRGFFSFTGHTLSTGAITAIQQIKVDNAGVWTANGSLTGAAILQGTISAAPGKSVIGGDIIANANITFTGELEVNANSMNIRNNAISTGGAITLGVINGNPAKTGNITITTGQNATFGNAVTLGGDIGAGSPLGIIEINHLGSLTIGADIAPVEIHAKRFAQKTAGKEVKLSAKTIETSGVELAGGILFKGDVQLLNTVAPKLLKLDTSIGGGNGNIVFEGTVKGNNDLFLCAGVTNAGSGAPWGGISFAYDIGGAGADPDADKIGSGDTISDSADPYYGGTKYAIDILRASSITMHGIRAQGPMRLDPTAMSLVGSAAMITTWFYYGNIQLEGNAQSPPSEWRSQVKFTDVEEVQAPANLLIQGYLNFDFFQRSKRLTIRSLHGSLEFFETVGSDESPLDLIAPNGAVLLNGSLLASTRSSQFTAKTDVLYIEAKALYLDRKNTHNYHVGATQNCGVRIFTQAGIRAVKRAEISIGGSLYIPDSNINNVDLNPPSGGLATFIFHAGIGKGDIVVQPRDSAATVYIADNAGGDPGTIPMTLDPSPLFYVPAYFLSQVRAERLFIGSIAAGGDARTHNYAVPVAGSASWRDGTGDIFIGKGTTGVISMMEANLYIFCGPNAAGKNIRFGFPDTGGIKLMAGYGASFYGEKSGIISARTQASAVADIEIPQPGAASGLITGALTFNAESIGTDGAASVTSGGLTCSGNVTINAPLLGNSANKFVEVTGSAYIKNLYAGDTALWGVSAGSAGSGSVFSFSNAGTINQNGPLTADTAHIACGKDINMNSASIQNAVDTVTLECTTPAASGAASGPYTIAFRNSRAELNAAALNQNPAGEIQLYSAGSLTLIGTTRPPVLGGGINGVQSAGGAINLYTANSAGTGGAYLYAGDAGGVPAAGAPVMVRTVYGGAGGALIRFHAPFISSAPGGPKNCTVAAGTSRTEFAQFAGALTKTNTPADNYHFETFTVESGALGKLSTAPELFIAANKLVLGTAAAVTLKTDSDAAGKRGVTLRVDGLEKHVNSTINAGDGAFQIYPMTVNKTIEYCPPSQKIGAPTFDVWYSSDWPSVTAGSFVIGGSTHEGDITLHDVAGAVNALTAQNSGNGAIIIRAGYSSQNKPLILKAGLGGVVLDGTSGGAAAAAAVNLGSAQFAVSNSALKLIHLTTGAISATGGITLAGVASDVAAPAGTNDLILASGAGALKITGDAGAPSARLGSLTLSSSAAAALEGSVYVTGSIITNTDITMAAAAAASPAALDSLNGSLLLNANHTITHTNGLNLFAGLNGFSGTQNGITGGGAAVELTLAAAAATLAGANKTVTLKSGLDYTAGVYPNYLVFTGENQNFDPNGAKLPNVRIDLAANAKTLTAQGSVTQSLPSLEIKTGSLALGGRDWLVSGGTGTGFAAGSGANITMNAGTTLTTDGDVTFASGAAAALDSASAIVFTGSGTANVNTAGAQKLGSIEIAASKTLSPSTDITLTGNWTGAGLAHNNKKVTFEVSGEHKIDVRGGSITFYALECAAAPAAAQTAAGTAVLKFDNYPARFIVQDELTLRGGGAGSLLTVTRLRDNPAPPPSRPESPTNAYWFLDPPGSQGAPGNVTAEYINVYYSFVEKTEPIEPPSTVTYVPYSIPNDESHYNVNWLARNMFVYAWTEDADGDGRLDRVRLQIPSQDKNGGAVTITGDVNKLKDAFIVEGGDYTVTKCEAVPSHPDMVYLYIQQKTGSTPDTGVTPSLALDRQKIPAPGDLKVTAGTREWPIDLYDSITVVDTAPPRITGIITIPDDPRVYIKLSEPVTDVNSLINKTFGKDVKSVSQPAPDEIVLELKDSFTAADVINKTEGLLNIFNGLKDKAAAVIPGDPFFYSGSAVQPKYFNQYYKTFGKNDSALVYSAVANQFDAIPWTSFQDISQPNVCVSKEEKHQISDAVLVMPGAVSPKDLLLKPIYAKDASGLSHISVNAGAIGTAVRFDLSERLRRTGASASGESGIQIEVTKNEVISADVTVWYAFDVTEEYRHKPASGVLPELGLWLPKNTSSALPNDFNAEALPGAAGKTQTPQAGRNLFYAIEESALKDKKTMEFIFEVNGLFVVRVDDTWKKGESLFDALRTFGFRFDDLRFQQGGVTVLHNVINPLKGELAALNYRIARGGQVTVQVFTLDGVLVRQLERGAKSAGDYTVSWDGTNAGGKPVARGMYFIRAVAPGIDEIRKVMVVK